MIFSREMSHFLGNHLISFHPVESGDGTDGERRYGQLIRYGQLDLGSPLGDETWDMLYLTERKRWIIGTFQQPRKEEVKR